MLPAAGGTHSIFNSGFYKSAPILALNTALKPSKSGLLPVTGFFQVNSILNSLANAVLPLSLVSQPEETYYGSAFIVVFGTSPKGPAVNLAEYILIVKAIVSSRSPDLVGSFCQLTLTPCRLLP